MYNIEQLKMFVYAVELGSFSGSARHLGKVQSAVSQGISNLEIDFNSRNEDLYNSLIDLSQKIRDETRGSFINMEYITTKLIGGFDETKNIITLLSEEVESLKNSRSSISELLEIKQEIQENFYEFRNDIKKLQVKWMNNNTKIVSIEKSILSKTESIKDLADSINDVVDYISNNVEINSMLDQIKELSKSNTNIENVMIKNKIAFDEGIIQLKDDFKNEVLNIEEIIQLNETNIKYRVDAIEKDFDAKYETFYKEIMNLIEQIRNIHENSINSLKKSNESVMEDVIETKSLISIIELEISYIKESKLNASDLNKIKIEAEKDLETFRNEIKNLQNSWFNNNQSIEKHSKELIIQAENLKTLTESTGEILTSILDDEKIKNIQKIIDDLVSNNKLIESKIESQSHELNNQIQKIHDKFSDENKNINDLMARETEKIESLISSIEKEFNLKNTTLYTTILDLIDEIRKTTEKLSMDYGVVKNSLISELAETKMLLIVVSDEIKLLASKSIDTKRFKKLERKVYEKLNWLQRNSDKQQGLWEKNSNEIAFLNQSVFEQAASISEIASSTNAILDTIMDDVKIQEINSQVKSISKENNSIINKLASYKNDIGAMREEIDVMHKEIIFKVNTLEKDFDNKHGALYTSLVELSEVIRNETEKSITKMKSILGNLNIDVENTNIKIHSLSREIEELNKKGLNSEELLNIQEKINQDFNIFKNEMHDLQTKWRQNNSKISNIERTLYSKTESLKDLADSLDEVIDYISSGNEISTMIEQIRKITKDNQVIEDTIIKNKTISDANIEDLNEQFKKEIINVQTNKKSISDIQESIRVNEDNSNKRIDAFEKDFNEKYEVLYKGIMNVIEEIRNLYNKSVSTLKNASDKNAKEIKEAQNLLSKIELRVSDFAEYQIESFNLEVIRENIYKELSSFKDEIKTLNLAWSDNNKKIAFIEKNILIQARQLTDLANSADVILEDILNNYEIKKMMAQVDQMVVKNKDIENQVSLSESNFNSQIESLRNNFNYEVERINSNKDEITSVRENINLTSNEIYERISGVERDFDKRYETLYLTVMEMIETIREDNRKTLAKMDSINKIMIDDVVDAKTVISKIANEIKILKSSNLNVNKLEDLSTYIDNRFERFIEEMSTFQYSWLTNNKKISALEENLTKYSNDVKKLINNQSGSINFDFTNDEINKISNELSQLRNSNKEIERIVELNKTSIEKDIQKLSQRFELESNNVKDEFNRIWSAISGKILENYEPTNGEQLPLNSALVDKVLTMINRNSKDIERYSDDAIRSIEKLAKQLDDIETKTIISKNDIDLNKALIEGIREIIKGEKSLTIENLTDTQISSIASSKLMPLVDETKNISQRLSLLEIEYNEGLKVMEDFVVKLIDDLETKVEIKIVDEISSGRLLTTEESKKIISNLAYEETNKLLHGYVTRREVNNDFETLKNEVDSTKNNIKIISQTIDSISIELLADIMSETDKLQKAIKDIEQLFNSSQNNDVLKHYYQSIDELKTEIDDNKASIEKLAKDWVSNEEKMITYDELLKDSKTDTGKNLEDLIDRVTSISNVNQEIKNNHVNLENENNLLKDELKSLVRELDNRANRLINTYLTMLSDYDSKIQLDIKNSIKQIDVVVDPFEIMESDIAKNVIREHAYKIAREEFERIKGYFNTSQREINNNNKNWAESSKRMRVIEEIITANNNKDYYEKLVNIDELFENVVDGIQEITEKNPKSKDNSQIEKKVKALEQQIDLIKSNVNNTMNSSSNELSEKTKESIKKLIEGQKKNTNKGMS